MDQYAHASMSSLGRSSVCRLGAGCSLAGVMLFAVLAGVDRQSAAQHQGKAIDPGDAVRLPIELDTAVKRPRQLQATMTPIGAFPSAVPAEAGRGVQCPPEVVTHSAANFEGGSFVLQAGFVAEEIAAVSFTADPQEFPIIIRTTEMILAQQSATVTTTTHYSIMVWEGVPNNGNLVAVYSSDDVILPHAVLPPGTNGLNIQITVDPQDPDQIVVQNFNNTNTFTVGYRIDQHNNPPTQSCNFGLTPAACCPPPTNSNAFPTTDTPPPNAPTHPTQNWLRCRDSCGLGACPGGWHRFSELGAFRPSGDWNIRVTYEPFQCPDEPFGACCPSLGECYNTFETICISDGGTFVGADTDCAVDECPDPVGACCFFPADPGPQGASCALETEAECATRNNGVDQFSIWTAGVPCSGTGCPDAIGACCFSDNSCVTLSFSNCGLAGGTFQGPDTACPFVCNPFGACCMPDGSCTDEFEGDCVALGGVFQGHDNLCASVNCPQPTGACCLANGNCINETEANCTAIPNASWAGMNTDCGDADMNGVADDCEKSPAVGACCLSSGSCIIEAGPNCTAIPGASYLGDGTDCEDCTAGCPADIADSGGPGSDGVVNVFDLLELLANWNTNGPGADISADGGGDQIVDVFDLLALLSYWSPTPCP